MTENLENIQESKAAKLAYYVALIPFLGIPLYLILAFFTFDRISNKGMAGFRLLKLGFVRMLRINMAVIIVIAAYWFFPSYRTERLIKTSSDGKRNLCIGKGYKIRLPQYPEKFVKIWDWQYTYNDKLIYKENYWFGNKENTWTWYNSKNQKIVEGRYKNDKKVGVWTYWKNGKKFLNAEYLPNGKTKWTFWFVNGKKEKEGIINGENLEGLWTYYYPNGKKRMEGVANKQDYRYRTGKWTYWEPNGVKGVEVYYDKNYNKRIVCFYDNGKIAYDTQYGKSYKTSKTIKYYSNGRKAFEKTYDKDRNIDTWQSWSPDGKHTSKNTASGEGQYIEWHESGQKAAEGNFKDGIATGLWNEWRENDKKKSGAKVSEIPIYVGNFGSGLGPYTTQIGGTRKYSRDYLGIEIFPVDKNAFWFDETILKYEKIDQLNYGGDEDNAWRVLIPRQLSEYYFCQDGCCNEPQRVYNNFNIINGTGKVWDEKENLLAIHVYGEAEKKSAGWIIILNNPKRSEFYKNDKKIKQVDEKNKNNDIEKTTCWYLDGTKRLYKEYKHNKKT